jgi:hypothetical protein
MATKHLIHSCDKQYIQEIERVTTPQLLGTLSSVQAPFLPQDGAGGETWADEGETQADDGRTTQALGEIRDLKR